LTKYLRQKNRTRLVLEPPQYKGRFLCVFKKCELKIAFAF
jgi:hypothetical protein